MKTNENNLYKTCIFHELDDGTLKIILNEFAGKKPTTNEIDQIQNYPNQKKLTLSCMQKGLTQELFNYLISNYARQFEEIELWGIKLISDLSLLSELKQLKKITLYHNQRNTCLWDQSKNTLLESLEFRDFTRIKTFKNIKFAPKLKNLTFGNYIHSTFIIDSLKPLVNLKTLKTLSFNFKKIINDGIQPLTKMGHLQEINFPPGSFETEEIAWLKSKLKGKSRRKMYNGTTNPKMLEGISKNVLTVGKRKPSLSSTQLLKIKSYEDKFDKMIIWYTENPKAEFHEYPPYLKKKKPTSNTR